MKQMRKTLVMLLCVCMVFSLASPWASAEKGETTEHEHAYVAETTEPNCTEEGYTTYTCACGDSYVGDYVEPLGHTPEPVEEQPASNTEPGHTAGERCSVCGEIFSGCEEIPMLVEEAEIENVASAENQLEAIEPIEAAVENPEAVYEEVQIVKLEGTAGDQSASVSENSQLTSTGTETVSSEPTTSVYSDAPANEFFDYIVPGTWVTFGFSEFANYESFYAELYVDGQEIYDLPYSNGIINISFESYILKIDGISPGSSTLEFYATAYNSDGASISRWAIDHVTVTDMTVPPPFCNDCADGPMGGGVHRFVAHVTNAQLVQFFIRDDAGHEKWYNTTDVNGDYICDIVLEEFGNSIGTYYAGIYAVDLAGYARQLGEFTFYVAPEEVMPLPVCNATADGPMGGGVHRFVVNVSNAQLVQFFIRDSAGHEKWYDTTDVNGDYICDVVLAEFGNCAGTYQAGVYVYDLLGTARHIGEYTFTVTEDEVSSVPLPVCNGSADGPMGGGVHRFVVNVSNAQLVQFFIRDDAGHEKWYDTTDVNGDYICDVVLAEFGNSVGTYQAGVYVYDLEGTARHIGEYTFTVTLDEILIPVCNGTADGRMGGGVHRFVVNVSNAKLVQFFIRDSAGHEKWYDTTDVNGDYICDVVLAEFGNSIGTYQAGVYVYDLADDAMYLGEYTFTVTADEVV